MQAPGRRSVGTAMARPISLLRGMPITTRKRVTDASFVGAFVLACVTVYFVRNRGFELC